MVFAGVGSGAGGGKFVSGCGVVVTTGCCTTTGLGASLADLILE
jgi:hypothetical protein